MWSFSEPLLTDPESLEFVHTYLYVPSFKGPDQFSIWACPDLDQASHVSSCYVFGVMAKTSASDRVLVTWVRWEKGNELSPTCFKTCHPGSTLVYSSCTVSCHLLISLLWVWFVHACASIQMKFAEWVASLRVVGWETKIQCSTWSFEPNLCFSVLTFSSRLRLNWNTFVRSAEEISRLTHHSLGGPPMTSSNSPFPDKLY